VSSDYPAAVWARGLGRGGERRDHAAKRTSGSSVGIFRATCMAVDRKGKRVSVRGRGRKDVSASSGRTSEGEDETGDLSVPVLERRATGVGPGQSGGR
jgi:hypothetical protein